MLGASSSVCSHPTGGEPGGEMRKLRERAGTASRVEWSVGSGSASWGPKKTRSGILGRCPAVGGEGNRAEEEKKRVQSNEAGGCTILKRVASLVRAQEEERRQAQVGKSWARACKPDF